MIREKDEALQSQFEEELMNPESAANHRETPTEEQFDDLDKFIQEMEFGEDLGKYQNQLNKMNARTVKRMAPSTAKITLSKGRCETVIQKRSIANSLACDLDDFSPTSMP